MALGHSQANARMVVKALNQADEHVVVAHVDHAFKAAIKPRQGLIEPQALAALPHQVIDLKTLGL